MQINWMRHIDYWVGKPLCGLLSAYSWLRRGFSGKPSDDSDPDKVLFIKLFGIGSVILSYPAVDAFKKTFPDATPYYLTFKSNEEIIETLSLVSSENIITIRDSSAFSMLVDLLKAIRFIRKERISVTVDFEFFSRFTAIFAFLTGARRRVGFFNYHTEGLSRGKLINVPVSYNHTSHTSEVFSHLTYALGVPAHTPELPRISIDDYALPPGPAAFDKLIIFNVNSSELITLRSWPSEHFANLADRILDEIDGAAIIFIGTETDKKNVEKVIGLMRNAEVLERVFNLTGETTLRDLIGLFERCDLLVSIDSGSPHIASLTDITIIDIFGPETPALYGPLSRNSTNLYLGLPCQPCVSVFNGKHSHCEENICLKQILPEQVMEIIKEELST